VQESLSGKALIIKVFMEFSQSQIELGHTYSVPYSYQRDSGEAIATAATVVTLVTVLTLAMIYWGVILWRLPS